jgi:segregation and condensation protein B
MAFNLQLVLKALLFSSSHPLSIKDIQAAFTRFHDQAQQLPVTAEEGASEPEERAALTAPENGSTSEPPAAEETSIEAPLAVAADQDLYADVPSLVTAAQIREAMDAIANELRAANDIYLLIEGAQGYRLVTHPRFARWVRILRNEPTPAKLSQSALETLAVIAYRQPVTRTEIESIRGVSADAGLNKLMERELVYITGRADLPGRPLQYGTTDKFLEFVGVKTLVELPASDVLSPRQIDEWLKNATNPSKPGDAEMGLPLEQGEGPSPMEDEAHLELLPEDATSSASTVESSPERPAADADQTA